MREKNERFVRDTWSFTLEYRLGLKRKYTMVEMIMIKIKAIGITTPAIQIG